MKINPVLRNESKLSVRNIKFNITILVYTAILASGALIFYSATTSDIYYLGLNGDEAVAIYIYMAIAQAVLLLFIVPSLTATLISSERERQTLDILLSTKLTPLQIIIGKMSSSTLKVIMLIIATMPLYTVATLIGGVRLTDVIRLILFFIVNTIFVASLGILVSSISKTSRVATVSTYTLVLGIYVGIFIICWIVMMLKASNIGGLGVDFKMIPLIYLTPLSGFIALLDNQIGFNIIGDLGIHQNAYYVSVIIQLVLSTIFVWGASLKLNPLKSIKKIGVKK